VAEVGPVAGGKRLVELPVLLASLQRLSSEAADAFAEDLERARSELSVGESEDLWDS
jgi:hypothetical protein